MLLSFPSIYLYIIRYTKAPFHHIQQLAYLSTVYLAITSNYIFYNTTYAWLVTSIHSTLCWQLTLYKTRDHFPSSNRCSKTITLRTKLDWLISFLSFFFLFLFPTFTYDWSSLSVDTRSRFWQASTQTKANLGFGGLVLIWLVPAWIWRFEPDSHIELSPVDPILHTVNKLSTLIIP